MDTIRILVFALVAFISISPAFVSAQSNGPDGGRQNFIAIPLYKSDGPVYALAGGEFDLAHDGLEVACLTSSGSVIQLSPNYLTWEVEVCLQGTNLINDMSTRPTIGIGDVHSSNPGGEIVLFNRDPSIMRVVYQDPNEQWTQEILDDKTDWIGNGWGARVGDYDPHRPGDEILFIFEPVFDQSIATLFREFNGIWEQETIYGFPVAAEVGMDSAVGDFNVEQSGPEIVIVTEMGPTYEVLKPSDDIGGDWSKRMMWEEFDNAAWVVKVADIDWWSPGNEVIYGTRYNNKILLSRHTGNGHHEVETLFTGNATEEPRNMWDIAIGDVLPRSPGLEILGVDHTGSVYLVRRVGEAWQGQVIWQDAEPLYAVVACDVLPQRSGEEILIAGEAGIVTLLMPHHGW